MKKLLLTLMATVVALSLYACGGDPEDNNTDDTDSGNCQPELISGELANGESCMTPEDCQSGLCLTFSHAPADVDATCESAPPVGDVHLAATVKDFMTGEPLAGVSLAVAGAIDVVANPQGFTPTDILASDSQGRIETILTGATVKKGLGLVVVASLAPDYYPTTTGLVEPELGCGLYPSGIRNSDIKLMKNADLEELSSKLLADFPAEAENLPLGEKGGIVGTVRHVNSGAGVAGCELRSNLGAKSTAKMLFLDEDEEHFVQGVSSSNGIFIILNAALAERFDAYIGTKLVSRRSATCGETLSVLFTTTIQVEGEE